MGISLRPTCERGSALLAALMLASVAISLVASLSTVARTAARDVRDRENALCARYAALAGIALGASADTRPHIVSTRVSALHVRTHGEREGLCVRRATARCDDVVRTVERFVACGD